MLRNPLSKLMGTYGFNINYLFDVLTNDVTPS